MPSSPLSGVSYEYLAAMQAAFDSDPASVEPGWRVLFQVLAEVGVPAADGTSGQQAALRDAALRDRGHLIAALDPLAPPAEPVDARLEPLRAAYAGTLTAESAHIDDDARRKWLRAAVERGDGLPEPAQPLDILRGLVAAEEFEGFLGRRFPTKKRFGAEGAEALIPLLTRVLERAAESGVKRAVIGTMHRGRLSIMTNVLGRSPTRLMAEIKNAHPFPADTPRAGDVPYHLGHDTVLTFGERSIRVTLLANPSHLEAVDPLVLGRARAAQEALGEEGKARVLPIVIHTDAAVIGQGVVAECIQLAGPAGYSTGGTVHLVVNNGIGFTTEAHEARTSRHCTGGWKAVDSAILHVNGDDPAAVCRAADIAVAWRHAQGCDAVVDLVCYRRNGHNEIDEPGFTQPQLYARIAEHTPVTRRYASALVRQGVTDEAAVDAMVEACRARLQAAYEDAAGFRLNESGYPPRPAPRGPETGVEGEVLSRIAATLAEPPGGAALHPRMGRILRQRAIEEGGIAWPTAEALAFGSLVLEGVPVRLSGQDVARGAFSHRHFALLDSATGERHIGLDRLSPGQARFQVHNSPLSEYAVLGFEYGYSLERPEALVIWEAQFGDFANGAQIVIDQFLAAAEEKWCDPSRLVVLLPHGLEGQGPEHSSARIERFLQLAARDNMRIANPSTPANYFHLLREQALGLHDRPLVVIAPKRLLRLPAAVSPLADFLPGSAFRPVVATVPVGPVHTVLLCSGKIAYDLEERAGRGAEGVAVLRLERLYPLPAEELTALLRRWPGARITWVQEEPENMGAWTWIDRRLEALATAAGLSEPRPGLVARPESPSPAGSFHGDHDADQAAIVERAFAAAPVARAPSAHETRAA
ncbi:2-oxoglutarate dehydrogenase E1 component [Roseomonas indoligenes]|uniref:2-oxoglutarate dehydrogenase E1 component n=1 Tax=Roseomonas indoligenes TaxID=2820811 RepID=A0A940SAE7_9PROT|nr:2-oxoglutarate dehydrogenase E1 component [Pararoseomonas indoligenes]MBP0496288.1 2-oxoglutarate dehydrogenase E1 component [Pararoseomonas indoligenes]